MKTKMKKLFLMLLAGLVLVACDKEGEGASSKSITISNQQQLTQIVYADDNVGKSGVAFTTDGAWTSEIKEPATTKSTRAAVDWLSISPSSGDKAGSYTMQLSLKTNFTGAKRSAVVNINCRDQTISISVTQEAKTASGDIPNVSDPNEIQSVTISPESISLYVGEKSVLGVYVDPKTAPNTAVSWSSDKGSVVSVNETTGEITAVAEGTAVITAVAKTNSAKKGYCNVTVINSPNILTEQYIPDPVFRAWINNNLANNSGVYYSDYASKIKGLTIKNTNITSLVGIKYFANLENLTCNNNQITSLDLSGLSKLRTVDCNNNKLEHLNVDNCSNLLWLYCDDNNLAQLSLSNASLDGFTCSKNKLTTLDLSACSMLRQVRCSENQLTELKFSDISWSLYCDKNQLESLNLEKFSGTYLNCSSNKLGTLDVSKAVRLDRLFCDDNQITALDVSRNVKLEVLGCSRNKLSTINVSMLPQLMTLDCYSNQFQQLDISENILLTRFSADPNLSLSKIKVWPTFNISSPPSAYSKPTTALYVHSF